MGKKIRKNSRAERARSRRRKVRVGRVRIPRVRHHLVKEVKEGKRVSRKRGNRKGRRKERALEQTGKAEIKSSKRRKKGGRIRIRSKITAQVRSRREL